MGSTSIAGQEGLEAPRYPRPTELANAAMIAMAPDLAAEVIRLRAEIAELRLQLGMANHAEDATRAENAELVAANALLVTDRTALEAKLAAADRLVQSAVRLVDVAVRISEVDNDNRMLAEVAGTQADIAKFRAIRGGGNG